MILTLIEAPTILPFVGKVWLMIRTAFTPLELVAVVFTLANVWLAIKEKMWTWPAGIVSVLLYLIVFWRSHLYLNAWLQVVYFVMSIHGWYEWLHGGKNKTELHDHARHAADVGGADVDRSADYLILLWLLRLTAHDASLPIWDAVTTAFSLVGQYMLNMKIVENWLIWALVDVDLRSDVHRSEALPDGDPLRLLRLSLS